jgi:cytochrome P450
MIDVLDFRPVFFAPMAVVMSHEFAEQISRTSALFKYSVPKSPTIGLLRYLIGDKSIIVIDGEDWKNTRRQFNRAFSTTHLYTLLPQIVDKINRFCERLDRLAEKGTEFALEEYCTALTFDVIGMYSRILSKSVPKICGHNFALLENFESKVMTERMHTGTVIMNEDFNCQQDDLTLHHDFVRHYRELLASYNGNFEGSLKSWLMTPFDRVKKQRISDKVDHFVKPIIQTQFQKLQKITTEAGGKGHNSDRSVLTLSLQGVEELTPDLIQSKIDSLKSFLFAGHDTTSVMLQWAFYELSRTPRALAALRTEHDQLLGPDTDLNVVSQILAKNENEILTKLSYTSAVIKETLRLYPPAASARLAPKGSGFTLNTKDGSYNVDGMVLYICHYAIQRDPAVYGETANVWIPERWLGDVYTGSGEDTTATVSLDDKLKQDGKVPVSAWRAFERGPRNCIGQEVANIEARIILAMAARRYDFTKVGLGASKLSENEKKPILNQHGQYEIVEELYNVRLLPTPFYRSIWLTTRTN